MSYQKGENYAQGRGKALSSRTFLPDSDEGYWLISYSFWKFVTPTSRNPLIQAAQDEYRNPYVFRNFAENI